MIEYDKLKQEIPDVLQSQALARYTTWNVGGPARYFVVVKDSDSFVSAVRSALRHDIPYYILGLGSNVLFPNIGFRGLVIRNESKHMEIHDDVYLVADAGTPLAQVAIFAQQHQLGGVEFGLGIPGTIGGGTVGNAGMKEFELKNIISRVWVVDIESDEFLVKEFSNADLHFAYRESMLKQSPYPVIKTELKLQKADPAAIQEKMKEWAKHRVERQPIGEKCAGSTFKNPSGNSAGQLIDKAGLKGYRIGGASVSQKHANFFINDGTATPQDIYALIKYAQQVVKAKFGVDLEPEVRIVGFQSESEL